METKDIDRVRKADIRLREQKERLERLEAVATKITSTIDGMPRGGAGLPQDERWADLADKRALVSKEIIENEKERKVLEKELEERIADSEIRFACELRYVKSLTVREVSEVMDFEMRTIYRILSKGRALYYGRA